MQFDVPPDITSDITFEQAIALAQSLLDNVEQNHVSVDQVAATLSALVATETGARGFFVVYLSDDRPMPDGAIAALISALESAPEVVSSLLIKNLAMSTAMTITHQRNGDENHLQSAQRTQGRTQHLLEKLSLPQLQDHAHQLLTSIDTNTGNYAAFLSRWGYDSEQRRAIRQILEQTILVSPS